MQFDVFLSILDLLQNPDKYAAQIAELKRQDESIQASTKEYGLTGDVVRAQKKADRAVEDANALMEQAKIDAAKIQADASSAFDAKYKDRQIREIAAEQAITAFRNSKLTWAQHQADHRAKEESLAAAQKQLEIGREALVKDKQEVSERLSKLRQVMG